MAGLQTDGFRINQTPSVVSALDPAKHSIDPSLLMRGLKDGMKFGSDIMKELDELSLRPDKLKAAKTKLEADTAVDAGRARVAPVAADSDIATNTARARVAPFKADSEIAQSTLDTAKNRAVLPFVPRQAALTQMGLDSDEAKASFAAQNLPTEQLNAGLRLSADSVKAQQEYDAANGAAPTVNDLTGTEMMVVNIGGKDVLVKKQDPLVAKSPSVKNVPIKNKVTGHDEIWAIKTDTSTGDEISRVKLGDAPGTEGKIRATAAIVAKLTGSLDLLKNAKAMAISYRNAGKGGPKEAVLANAAQTKAGMNPFKVGLRALGGSLADPDTLSLNSAINAASTEIQNALFGSALTEGEASRAIALLPQTDDIADPALMVNKIDGALKFISTKLEAFSKEMPQVVSPGDVAPANGVDLTGVPVTANGAAQAPVSISSFPAGTRVGQRDGRYYVVDAQGREIEVSLPPGR